MEDSGHPPIEADRVTDLGQVLVGAAGRRGSAASEAAAAEVIERIAAELREIDLADDVPYALDLRLEGLR